LFKRVIQHAAPAVILLAVVAAPAAQSVAATPTTAITIDGAEFRINGELTYAGTSIEGLLMNARMINAAFDDENSQTRGNWVYPDTGVWSADRNTDEFVAAVPAYAEHGLRAVTVGLQGGRPMQDTAQSWSVSAFTDDGSMKAAWTARLDRVIRACETSGIVVIVSLFYKAQDHRLDNEAAVVRAVDEVADWLLAEGYENVLVEIGNETNDVGWDHAILREGRIAELISRVQSRSNGRLLVSTSFGGGYIPPDDVIRQSDFVLVHGNHQSSSGIRSMVDKIRARSAYSADPKPIVFNEDSTELANLEAAIDRGSSWGYHDRGSNNYRDGYQSVPINWSINTTEKRAFFDRLNELSTVESSPPGEPPPHGLSVSDSPDRSNPVALEGTTVQGSIYVFVASGTGVGEVRFYLDDPVASGPPAQVEKSAPFDFAGSESELSATPFDTNTIPDGVHTITARIDFDSGTREWTSASFTVANGGAQPEPGALVWQPESLSVEVEQGGHGHHAVELRTSNGASASYSIEDDAPWLTATPASGSLPATPTLSIDSTGLEPGTYTAAVTASAPGLTAAVLSATLTVEPKPQSTPVLLVSHSADRSSPLDLRGATVSGSIFVFAEPGGAVERVRFYLDDPDRLGKPRRVETSPPWDFTGSTSTGKPRPFDTRKVSNGSHVITAAVERPNGTTEVTSATFDVRNP
jgi:hypothetical protein